MEEGEDSYRMNVLVASSIFGAVFYTVINRCLTGGQSNSVTASAKKDAHDSAMQEAAAAAAGGSGVGGSGGKAKKKGGGGGGGGDEESVGMLSAKGRGGGSGSGGGGGGGGGGRNMGSSSGGGADGLGELLNHGGGEEAVASTAAFSIWLGILIDGVPESMLIGFMQSEGQLSLAFVVAVFLANFPEVCSG